MPYADAPFEYPPGVGYVAGAFSLLAADATAYVVAWGALVVLVACACAYGLAVTAGVPRALRYWSLAPQLLLFAGMNFDVLPATLVAASVVAARKGRGLVAIVALALGTVTKLFPAFAAPLVIARAWRGKERMNGVALALVFGGIVLGVYLPSLAQPHSSLVGLGYHSFALGANLDSVWGLAAGALAAVGLADPAPTIFVVTTVGLLATYVLAVLPRALRAADAAVGFALATVSILFWARFYSPQFSLWLLPFFVLLPLSGGTFALLSLADILVFLTISPLSLVRWGPDDGLATVLLAVLAAAVVLRHAALVMAWREVWRTPDRAAAVRG